MKIDYHVHLEEGPYSFRWLDRTSQAINAFHLPHGLEKGSKEYINWQINALKNRLDKGCYSEEWLDYYLIQAKQLGLREVGMVDHLYRFKETKAYFEKNMVLDESDLGKVQRYWLDSVMTETMNDFVENILQAKEKWRSEGVELKLGIEADYFVGYERELKELLRGYPWDYIIGSVHFVDGWGFDNPQTVDKFEGIDLKTLYERFFTTVEKAIRSELFDFVAHLDNLKVFNFKVDNMDFVNWYKRIAEALVEKGTATEVNAGLYYRYPVKEMCPGPDFVKVLVDHGVEFTVSSDSHYPDDLGKFTEMNAAMLKNLGIQKLVGFEQRVKKYHSL
ncbi:histidinol phosphate phosphatase domain-containing protein [Psychrobacillus lasiicapitis]|uniref:Histidinol-phosphatase n=1 Tax=Psychrobacillus lasiicapitis TaxID=1636719 RepID=A0A544T1K7_9BACI|nr:histidinol phosphate phosphatase domain-containing protein [Psychrobacillus lasiicapitis]TQR11336.1 histidinol phosphate phosphatase domain-containing protein [Psychrobacillus lasiicapitis]GGA41382.1 histidinol-phosphatase [Psychrobacillus lasiicapitis]